MMSLSLITIYFEARQYTRDLLKGRPTPFATSHMVGREGKRTNNRTMFPALKINAAAGYKGPV